MGLNHECAFPDFHNWCRIEIKHNWTRGYKITLYYRDVHSELIQNVSTIQGAPWQDFLSFRSTMKREKSSGVDINQEVGMTVTSLCSMNLTACVSKEILYLRKEFVVASVTQKFFYAERYSHRINFRYMMNEAHTDDSLNMLRTITQCALPMQNRWIPSTTTGKSPGQLQAGFLFCNVILQHAL